MCSSLVSALLEYLASVKCDSTFLKWIWGLIKSTCVYNKWGYFYYSFYFYLQAIFAVIMQKKPKKTPRIRNPTQHMVQAQLSKLWVAEFGSCGSKWNGHAPQREDLAASGVCSPSHPDVCSPHAVPLDYHRGGSTEHPGCGPQQAFVAFLWVPFEFVWSQSHPIQQDF